MAQNQQQNPTVLGVAIKSDYGVDLADYNALNSSFGCSMTVCTNRWDAPELKHVTNVKLPGGNVHLELAGASGQFAVWYLDRRTWTRRKLLDSATMPVLASVCVEDCAREPDGRVERIAVEIRERRARVERARLVALKVRVEPHAE